MSKPNHLQVNAIATVSNNHDALLGIVLSLKQLLSELPCLHWRDNGMDSYESCCRSFDSVVGHSRNIKCRCRDLCSARRGTFVIRKMGRTYADLCEALDEESGTLESAAQALTAVLGRAFSDEGLADPDYAGLRDAIESELTAFEAMTRVISYCSRRYRPAFAPQSYQHGS